MSETEQKDGWAKDWVEHDFVNPSPYMAENPTGAPLALPARDGGLVVPIPTAADAEAAVNATLDSADEADLRELSNSQGDLHEKGSSEENAEALRAAAVTADELAVKQAEEELEAELEAEMDAQMDRILASPAVDAMLNAALEDAEQDENESDKSTKPNPEFLLSLTNQRIGDLERKVAEFEVLLNQFKERALAAFKHAGFKF